MAYVLNELSSFTLDYKRDFIDEPNGEERSWSILSVGSLLLGYSYQINDYSSPISTSSWASRTTHQRSS